MITHLKTYTLLSFLLLCCNQVTAQEIYLKITSKDSIENKLLQSLTFQKKFSQKQQINQELHKLSNTLKRKGYFHNTFYTTKRSNDTIHVLFTANKKINGAILMRQETITKLTIEQLEPYLNALKKEQDALGNSFSKITLKNIETRQDTIVATIDTQKSKTRKIDRVTLKGYTNFPKSYLKNYLEIFKSNFNKKRLTEIEKKIQLLDFCDPIKKPEVLFSQDSTILFLYIKKVPKSSFDGMVNFSNNENNKGIAFSGVINLDLKNILHTGEVFKLHWKSTQNISESFEIGTELPYVFNTPLSAGMTFRIHKQDSSFLNTHFLSKIATRLNPKLETAITFQTESSKNSLNINNLNINDFTNYFFGLSFLYEIKNTSSIFEDTKFSVVLKPNIGNRSYANTTNTQFKWESKISYLWNVSKTQYVKLGAQFSFIDSETLLSNELFRIGGLNNFRGFMEESIFASSYSLLSLEYHIPVNQRALIYSLLDFGQQQNPINRGSLLGIGIGFKQQLKNTLLNLEYTLGKSQKNDFNINKSIINIKITSFF